MSRRGRRPPHDWEGTLAIVVAVAAGVAVLGAVLALAYLLGVRGA